ncbi:MAG: hypothetical protein ABIE22_04875 [archaeon]
MADLSLIKILGLAGADAVNPCALAVLTLILTAVLSVKRDKKAVLKAGFMFILAVLIFYFLYGLIMVTIFKSLSLAIASVRIYLFNGLAVLAMLLGAMNVKDSIWYKPGGILTEMPMFLRPKLKKLISGITSPKGAFFIGILVTFFLLPCTIGPYIIASGILSNLEIINIIPWLIIYNFIFILPMIAIVVIVYVGYSSVDNVGGWKEKNIRWLHLIAGLLLFVIGLLMLLGVI